MTKEFVPGEIILNLALVAVLVLLNGFFVAAEFALVKVRSTRLTQLRSEGNKKADYALRVTHRLDAYLSATQLGITLASLGLGWVGEPAVSHMIVEPLLFKFGVTSETVISTVSLIIGFLVITFLHIVLGELAPKSLAIQKAEGVSLWLSGPLMFFYKVFKPAIVVLNGAANGLLKLFGIAPASEHETAHTEEEIRLLVNQSAKSGVIDSNEMKLVDNIFDFSDMVAREVMLPRTDMDCLFANQSFGDNLNIVYRTKHTRYPVGLEDKDQIIGFVHITDLLTADAGRNHNVRELIRPVLNVPESMEISQVLQLMQRRHSQLAIVVDEYGGTAGMLTTEMILEEIVGEIHDEFDLDQPSVVVKDQVTTVEGRMLIDDINDMFRLDIEDEDVDSIGGWLFIRLEGNPARGKKVVYGEYVFEIADCQRLRVLRVHIYRDPAAEALSENAEQADS
ncbi:MULTISPECIES: hemolysin family protein [Paenibacillus]|uniref:hemolysin family protein n=1 Tax=Paenibacillus TaxID=44249 RepID=UPI0004258876|nr:MULTISPECIES: hemolysin family protein [Paenibacillus]KKC47364.1 membrane protein [Paenibacillus sp. D9]